jgi:chemosensory pili system protein ChpA (sensor histidine kinase/response regulator)
MEKRLRAGEQTGLMEPRPRPWILVVDDDPQVRQLAIEILTYAGYQAVGAAEGLAAIELVRDVSPDLVLLDLHMPRTAGQHFLENLRAHPYWRSTPILIVSGHTDELHRPPTASTSEAGWRSPCRSTRCCRGSQR